MNLKSFFNEISVFFTHSRFFSGDRLFLLILFLINLVFLPFAFQSLSSRKINIVRSHPSSPPGDQIFEYPVPEVIDFAGEKVPLKDPLIREKLDAALANNIFRHSKTLLSYKRANRWFPAMKGILKKNQVPEDFAYLSVIESNLLNLISVKGATGFWQFMPETGKQYGLEINEEVDERYHPLRSTEAACQYLKDAYRKFNNWTLVAASYNMGMNGLKNRLDKQQGTTFYDLNLYLETNNYIYEILAIKTIFEKPEVYGYRIAPHLLYAPLKTKSLPVSSSIPDLSAFAKSENISYHTLKELNPWLRSNSLTIKTPGKSYILQLPEKE